MGSLEKVDLDSFHLHSSGEGDLDIDARWACEFAEQILVKQFANPELEFQFTGKAVWLLAHLAQLEAWTGLCLCRRKIISAPGYDQSVVFRNARSCVRSLGPLSLKDWGKFYSRGPSRPDFDLMEGVFDVSVVVPAYQPEKFVNRFVENLSKWSSLVREILVVSDGNSSKDETLLEEKLSPVANLRLLKRSKNSGPGAARNYGISQATSTWLTFLDFDDTLEPFLFKILLQCLKRSKNSLFCSHLKKQGTGSVYYAKRFSFPDIAYKNQVAVNLFIKKELLDSFESPELYNEKLSQHFEDWELNILLRLMGYRPYVVGLCTYNYWVNDGSRQTSEVSTQWDSRQILSAVFSRLPRERLQRFSRGYLYLLTLKLQSLAQREHENLSESLFLKRAGSFYKRFSASDGGKLVTKLIGKSFEKLSGEH